MSKHKPEIGDMPDLATKDQDAPEVEVVQPTTASVDNVSVVDPVAPVSSVDPAAPPGGGHFRKPKNWEPPHVHAPAAHFTYVKVEPDGKGFVVHVGFDDEEAAHRFASAFEPHLIK